jgi:hypothetical protein
MLNGLPVTETVPGNGGTVSLSVDATKLEQGSNEFTIVASSSCGQFPLDNRAIIHRSDLITDQDITSTAQLCAGQSGSIKISSSQTGFSYRAMLNGLGASELTAGNGSSLELAIGAENLAPGNNDFTIVAVSDACGELPLDNHAAIYVLDIRQAKINVEGDRLISDSALGNQWYFNGQPIPNATGTEIIARESGVYQLEVTLGDCRSTTEVEFLVTGLEYTTVDGVSIYPNPFEEAFTVRISSPNEVKMRVINPMGIQIGRQFEFRANARDKEARFDLSGSSSGVYIVRIQDGTRSHSIRILKK